eukprot:5727711-Pleurochrysis_carterae.AAC.6
MLQHLASRAWAEQRFVSASPAGRARLRPCGHGTRPPPAAEIQPHAHLHNLSRIMICIGSEGSLLKYKGVMEHIDPFSGHEKQRIPRSRVVQFRRSRMTQCQQHIVIASSADV